MNSPSRPLADRRLTDRLLALTLQKNDLPFEISVTGGSMSPSLKNGDCVAVRREDAYLPGDIVVFRQNGGLTVHRLLWQAGGRAVCKGDSNLFREEVSAEDILGKVIEIRSGDVRFPPAYGPLLAALSYEKLLIFQAHGEDKLSTRRDPAYAEIQHFLHGLRYRQIRNGVTE